MSLALTLLRRAAMSLAFLTPLTSVAATHIWPGSMPCNSTLSTCLADVAANDTVEIRSNAVIDTDLIIGKPMRVVAADGFQPTLAAGRNVYATIHCDADCTVTIDGLHLKRGEARALITGTGHTNVVIRRLVVTGTAENFASPLVIWAFEGASVTYDVGENHVNTISTLNGIEIAAYNHNAMSGSVHDNRIDVTANHSAGDAWGGAGINVVLDANDTTRIYSNRIRGDMLFGIVTDGFNSPGATATSVIANNAVQNLGVDGVGIRAVAFNEGDIDAFVVNNSVVGLSWGVVLVSPAVTAELANNLVAFNGTGGFFFNGANVSHTRTLYYANGGPMPVLDDGSIIDDPRLRRGRDDIRLTVDSKAVGAGSAVLPARLRAEFGIPYIDADGLRRFKTAGGDANVDIGAYEFGDESLIHRVTAGNTTGPASRIDAYALDGAPTRNALITASLAPDTYRASANPSWTGVDYADGHHRVVNENAATPSVGAAYHVFVPAPGAGDLTHTTQAGGGSSSFMTLLQLDYLDDGFLVQHRVAPAELFDHGVQLWIGYYFDIMAGTLSTTDQAPFAPGLDFALYAQPSSYAAFHVSQAVAGTALPIRHPSLDGEPCARAYASPASGTRNPKPHALDYDRAAAHWKLVNLDGSTIPTGASYGILVDEAATDQCRYDHVFHDGHDTL